MNAKTMDGLSPGKSQSCFQALCRPQNVCSRSLAAVFPPSQDISSARERITTARGVVSAFRGTLCDAERRRATRRSCQISLHKLFGSGVTRHRLGDSLHERCESTPQQQLPPLTDQPSLSPRAVPSHIGQGRARSPFRLGLDALPALLSSPLLHGLFAWRWHGQHVAASRLQGHPHRCFLIAAQPARYPAFALLPLPSLARICMSQEPLRGQS